jgi:hypothetical protein
MFRKSLWQIMYFSFPQRQFKYKQFARFIHRLPRFFFFSNAAAGLSELVDNAISHQVAWNGSDALGKLVGSGVYVYRLTCGERTLQKRMVFIR